MSLRAARQRGLARSFRSWPNKRHGRSQLCRFGKPTTFRRQSWVSTRKSGRIIARRMTGGGLFFSTRAANSTANILLLDGACRIRIGDRGTTHVTFADHDMPSSTVSVCNEPDDFQAALGRAGESTFLVTAAGPFRPEIIRVVLHHLSVTFVHETVTRVAFMRLPADSVRVLVPVGDGGLVFGGITVRPGEIATHRAIATMSATHERLTGACQWRDIVLSGRFFDRYSRALLGQPIAVPAGVRRWRPPAPALRRLIALHSAATRLAATQPGNAVNDEAARGLEQELITIVAECLSGGAANAAQAAPSLGAGVIGQFEDIIAHRLRRPPSIMEICAETGVAPSTLRAICNRHLGMPPQRYIRLRRMQSARQALRSRDAAAAGVIAVAKQFGFNEPGEFSRGYRAIFGEPPSATWRRSMGH